MPDLHVTVEHDGSVGTEAVRAALTDLDVSVSSPVDADGRKLGVYHDTDDGTDRVHVVNDGHDGEWTKTSQSAVTDALTGIDGVDGESLTVEGGYEPDSTDES